MGADVRPVAVSQLAWIVVALSALTLVGAPLARAQAVADSGDVARWPLAVWGSFGVGSGSVRSSPNRGGLVSATGRVSGSAGPVMLTYRDGDIGPFISSGDGVRDRALLLGARTPGRRLFGSASLGYAHATPRHDCENCGPNRTGVSADVLAYDVMAHINLVAVGLAVSFSGTAGPARVSYSAVGVNLELGFFGW